MAATPAGSADTAAMPVATPVAASAPEGTNDIIPCDCVLIRGAAVVNEASLTGESVPQMKDQLPSEKGK